MKIEVYELELEEVTRVVELCSALARVPAYKAWCKRAQDILKSWSLCFALKDAPGMDGEPRPPARPRYVVSFVLERTVSEGEGLYNRVFIITNAVSELEALGSAFLKLGEEEHKYHRRLHQVIKIP
jgi:hypothetical protein